MRHLAVAALFLTVVPFSFARADEPSFVVYHQGRLLGPDDVPVEGTQAITVGLYASETAEAPRWSQAYQVVVSKGTFAIALGDTRGGKLALTAADVEGERWLSITLNSVELKPRMRVGSAPYALLATNALALGGSPAADFVKKAEFDGFKTALTGGGSGVSVPWTNITGIPADFGAGLRKVETASAALSGDGTTQAPLKLANAGIDTALIKDGAITPAKLAGGCQDGEILKLQGGQWACAADAGSGSTLNFNVTLPLEGIAGSGGGLPGLRLKDAGIDRAKLANDAVDASKLATDLTSLGKISGSALTVTSAGSLGVGVASPTARLEVADLPSTGTAGAGSVSYTANALTVALSGADFRDFLLPGDSIQLGSLGWKTVTVVAAASVTLESGYSSAFSGTWSARRATLRLGAITQTATGNVGIGTVSPAAKLHVGGLARFKIPAFQADGGSAHQLYPVGVLKFTNEQFDTFSNYEPTTGVFTASVPGVYSCFTDFDVHEDNSTGAAWYIRKNGANFLMHDNWDKPGVWKNYHLQGLIPLAVGDTVDVYIGGNLWIAMQSWSKFGCYYVSDL